MCACWKIRKALSLLNSLLAFCKAPLPLVPTKYGGNFDCLQLLQLDFDHDEIRKREVHLAQASCPGPFFILIEVKPCFQKWDSIVQGSSLTPILLPGSVIRMSWHWVMILESLPEDLSNNGDN